MFRAVCRTHLQNNPDYRWFYEEKEERDSQVPRRWSVWGNYLYLIIKYNVKWKSVLRSLFDLR